MTVDEVGRASKQDGSVNFNNYLECEQRRISDVSMEIAYTQYRNIIIL